MTFYPVVLTRGAAGNQGPSAPGARSQTAATLICDVAAIWEFLLRDGKRALCDAGTWDSWARASAVRSPPRRRGRAGRRKRQDGPSGVAPAAAGSLWRACRVAPRQRAEDHGRRRRCVSSLPSGEPGDLSLDVNRRNLVHTYGCHGSIILPWHYQTQTTVNCVAGFLFLVLILGVCV